MRDFYIPHLLIFMASKYNTYNIFNDYIIYEIDVNHLIIKLKIPNIDIEYTSICRIIIEDNVNTLYYYPKNKSYVATDKNITNIYKKLFTFLYNYAKRWK